MTTPEPPPYDGPERRSRIPLSEALKDVRSLQAKVEELKSAVDDAVPRPEWDAAETRRNNWQRMLILVLVIVIVGMIGNLWISHRVDDIASSNEDFAKAHATASYQRALVTLQVMQCEADWFVGQQTDPVAWPAMRLHQCFTVKLPPPTEHPVFPAEPAKGEVK